MPIIIGGAYFTACAVGIVPVRALDADLAILLWFVAPIVVGAWIGRLYRLKVISVVSYAFVVILAAYSFHAQWSNAPPHPLDLLLAPVFQWFLIGVVGGGLLLWERQVEKA